MKLLNLVFLISLVLTSCSKDINLPDADLGDSQESPKEYLVKLSVSGEITSELSPITKSLSTDDAYGINVYYDKNGDGNIVDKYAWGLFDNTDDMEISLLSGHQYSFECTLIKNAKNVIYYNKGFGCPFQTIYSNIVNVTNKFNIGTNNFLKGISSPLTSLDDIEEYLYASVDRYYGSTSGYTPVQNGTVTILLKRMVFGAKFNVSGLRDGRLWARCDFWDQTLTSDYEGPETIYTIPDFKNEEFSQTVRLNFTSNISPDYNLASTISITFKRNMLTIVNINVSPLNSTGLITLTEEEIGDVVNNVNLGINDGGLVDIIVDPKTE